MITQKTLDMIQMPEIRTSDISFVEAIVVTAIMQSNEISFEEAMKVWRLANDYHNFRKFGAA